MTVSPEELDRVRREGLRRRRQSRKDQKRAALAPVVDVGSLDDDDVDKLYTAYTAGKDEPPMVLP